jgi:hypothetical protein
VQSRPRSHTRLDARHRTRGPNECPERPQCAVGSRQRYTPNSGPKDADVVPD